MSKRGIRLGHGFRLTNRRDFLKLAAGATLGAVAGPAITASAHDAQSAGNLTDVATDFLSGTVVSLGSNDLVLGTDSGSRFKVSAGIGAQLYSGVFGRVSSLDRFILGDHIGIRGIRGTDGITASRAGSIFRLLEFTVQSVDNERDIVHSDSGPLSISSMQLPDVGSIGIARTVISAGQRLSGLVWTHPTTATTYLAAASLG